MVRGIRLIDIGSMHGAKPVRDGIFCVEDGANLPITIQGNSRLMWWQPKCWTGPLHSYVARFSMSVSNSTEPSTVTEAFTGGSLFCVPIHSYSSLSAWIGSIEAALNAGK
jgi:hypothetical protein